MQRIIQHCGTQIQQEMLRFPKLYEKIVDVVTAVLRRRLPVANTMVENLVAIELAYINTKHPDFGDAELVALLSTNASAREVSKRMATSTTVAQPQTVHGLPHGKLTAQNDPHSSQLVQPTSAPSSNITSPKHGNTPATNAEDATHAAQNGDPIQLMNGDVNPLTISKEQKVGLSVAVIRTDQTTNEAGIINRNSIFLERLIRNYFLIVRKAIQDAVPKSIMHFLVNFVKLLEELCIVTSTIR
uniref:GED domain-containing protein n=1 Tax=Romanomermis culicivorax TaxID=13658 RepID=A0A915K0R1_ROMCU